MKIRKIVKRKIINGIASFTLFLISTSVCLGAGELVLRAKNSRMDNYDIEMWKYSNELKTKSDNIILDYEHRKNRKGVFQNIEIQINEKGLRGDELKKSSTRRILVLGGSITLGWGVNEDEVWTNRVEQMFRNRGEDVEVLNAGVGNYNANRYVTRFFEKLVDLEPTDIVVNYFLRDAEDLKPSKPNYLLRNSQIAVTVWTAIQRAIKGTGESSIEINYESIYKKNKQGYKTMERKLKELADYAKSNNIRIYIVMMPDINNLIDYKFDHIHKMIAGIAKTNNYIFIDTLPNFKGRASKSLYAMPGDPHPNSLGHKIIAEKAFPALFDIK